MRAEEKQGNEEEKKILGVSSQQHVNCSPQFSEHTHKGQAGSQLQ